MEKYRIVFEVADIKGDMIPNKYAWELGFMRAMLDYKVTTPTGVVLDGSTFVPSSNIKWDSPESILQFVSLITDYEPTSGGSFEGYDDEQMAWFRSGECRDLNYIFGEDTLYKYMYYDPTLSTIEWDVYSFTDDCEARAYIIKMRREEINV